MPKRKKVMYFITKNTRGRGGHYYSLKTTVKALNEKIEPYIVTISKINSPETDELHVVDTTIYCNGWNFIYVVFALMRIVQKEKPAVFHAFDSSVLLFARIISYVYKIPLLYTKCGGENPAGFYPYAKEIILYSYENLEFFKSESKLKSSNFYLIPNRVGKIKKDEKRITLIREKIDLTKKTFLRIARFGSAYKKSIMQAIDLILFLNSKGIEVQLVLIGIIQEMKAYNEIIDYIGKHKKLRIYIFSEDEFTINASEMIDLTDCVIGTGRSLMEAASRNKILFTPVEESKLPVLITEKNFIEFFNTNFSPRNQLSKDLLNKNEKNILRLFESHEYFLKQQHFSKLVFEKYFNIDIKKEEYYHIYSRIKYDKTINILNFIEHFIRTIVSFFKKIK